MRPPPGIAAGHPATAEAGLEVLAGGGSAADAAVAGLLASCVAETVMTGVAGGGHAVYWEKAERRARMLDFFVAVPGLGGAPRAAMIRVPIPFGNETIEYDVGIASCGVPGIPAGAAELWRAHGRLPWTRLVEPALRLAQDGVSMPPAHASCLAMLEPVLTLDAGERIYRPNGRLLATGDRLEQPGLVRTMELLAEEGGRTFYEGTLAGELLALMDERGGPVTRDDLRAYRAVWRDPVAGNYAGYEISTRSGLSGLTDTLARLPPLRGLDPAARALTLVRTLGPQPRAGHTTNLAVVDEEGNACAATTSLGLGAGAYLPGLDVHLNSMLGEHDLLVGGLGSGERMESMMSPLVAADAAGLVLAGGAAGGARLRGALVQVLSGILDEGLAPQEAVERPRLHPVVGDIVHLEPGFPAEVVAALEDQGSTVRCWPDRHHYFGGVSLIARGGAAADPRRSGAALLLG